MLIGHILLLQLELLIFSLEILISLGKGHYFISLLCIALEKFLGMLLPKLSHLTLHLFLLRLLLCECCHFFFGFDILDCLR